MKDAYMEDEIYHHFMLHRNSRVLYEANKLRC